jgi:hypothetical protein
MLLVTGGCFIGRGALGFYDRLSCDLKFVLNHRACPTVAHPAGYILLSQSALLLFCFRPLHLVILLAIGPSVFLSSSPNETG